MLTMRRNLIPALAVAALLSLPAKAQDIIIRRPDGRYEGSTLPGRPREVRPVPGTSSSAIYDSRGRRIGTVEQGPAGPAVRDNRGTRR